MELDGSLDVDVRPDSVVFTFTVTNAGSDEAELSFSDAQTADFAVLDGDQEIWRHSEGMMFAQMLQTRTVAPGDAAAFDGEWEDPRSGDFEVVATLEANDADLEVRESFSV
jgi:hypothetical protein